MREIKHHIVEGKAHNEKVLAFDGGKYELFAGCEVPQVLYFHQGEIKELKDIDGISNEQVLCVLIDRLEQFVDFCPEEYTIRVRKHLYGAMDALKARSVDRIACGVEGKHEP